MSEMTGMSLVFEPVQDGSGKWLLRQYDLALYFRDDETAFEYAVQRGYTPIFLEEATCSECGGLRQVSWLDEDDYTQWGPCPKCGDT